MAGPLRAGPCRVWSAGAGWTGRRHGGGRAGGPGVGKAAAAMSAPRCWLSRAPPFHGTPGPAGAGAEAGLGVHADVAAAVMAGASEAAARGGAALCNPPVGSFKWDLLSGTGKRPNQGSRPPRSPFLMLAWFFPVSPNGEADSGATRWRLAVRLHQIGGAGVIFRNLKGWGALS